MSKTKTTCCTVDECVGRECDDVIPPISPDPETQGTLDGSHERRDNAGVLSFLAIGIAIAALVISGLHWSAAGAAAHKHKCETALKDEAWNTMLECSDDETYREQAYDKIANLEVARNIADDHANYQEGKRRQLEDAACPTLPMRTAVQVCYYYDLRKRPGVH